MMNASDLTDPLKGSQGPHLPCIEKHWSSIWINKIPEGYY